MVSGIVVPNAHATARWRKLREADGKWFSDVPSRYALTRRQALAGGLVDLRNGNIDMSAHRSFCDRVGHNLSTQRDATVSVNPKVG